MGSATRRSISKNATRPTAATANSDRICQEAHGYWWPPQVMASTREQIQTLSTPAPHQSMTTLPSCARSWERCRVDQTTNSETTPSGRLT